MVPQRGDDQRSGWGGPAVLRWEGPQGGAEIALISSLVVSVLLPRLFMKKVLNSSEGTNVPSIVFTSCSRTGDEDGDDEDGDDEDSDDEDDGDGDDESGDSPRLFIWI